MQHQHTTAGLHGCQKPSNTLSGVQGAQQHTMQQHTMQQVSGKLPTRQVQEPPTAQADQHKPHMHPPDNSNTPTAPTASRLAGWCNPAAGAKQQQHAQGQQQTWQQ
jgi:hypothetical protein